LGLCPKEFEFHSGNSDNKYVDFGAYLPKIFFFRNYLKFEQKNLFNFRSPFPIPTQICDNKNTSYGGIYQFGAGNQIMGQRLMAFILITIQFLWNKFSNVLQAITYIQMYLAI
jgi:hypothetical protein